MILTIPVTVYICDNCKNTTANFEKVLDEWLGNVNDEMGKHYCTQECADSMNFEDKKGE